ncbi:MAG TPA: cytochrome c biogenesis protein ResB [Candidatus Nanopelagicales bacterium]|nr:cytochrome c biogenesis protein ResB [Candidatus Nanopelagicales bacterium]
MTDLSEQPSDTDSAGMSTAPKDVDGPVGLGVVGWLRWAWRTLTSMRTALVLLFLLALASVPGSLLPQRGTDPIKVTQYLADDPTKGRIFDKLGLFDVFAAPWFAAIYLLLFVSLVGCVIPRAVTHWRVLRSRPPRAPRNLGRLPEHRVVDAPGDPAAVLEAARSHLRSRLWRVDVTSYDGSTGSLAAEKGYARETGNLLFHVALIGILAGVALGALTGFKGTVIVREGSSFADTRAQFDAFAPGRFHSDDALPPFSFTLDRFTAGYQRGGQQNGAAREFAADVTLVRSPGDAPERTTVEVNDPLEIDGVKVFLVGHGYAPTFTVKNAKGEVVFQDSVVFLPQDGYFTSTGVVKVPDTVPQLGLQGVFLPSAVVDDQGARSVFPAADDPAVFLTAWTGDLGLDSGRPQSVYTLETSAMKQVGVKGLRPGQSWALPDGTTVSLDGYVQWASFSVARDPGKELALVAGIVAMSGLALSLLVRRRRVWVRVSALDAGVTVVEVAGLARSEHATVADEVDALAAALGTVRTDRTTGSPPAPGAEATAAPRGAP